MNAHIPQSYEAHTELEDIASVPLQIIRPRDGEPVIGIVQDTLVGSYLATKPDNYFTRREFMNLMMWNKRFEKLPVPRVDADGPAPRYTGQQIISTLLPPINVTMPNSNHKKTKADMDYVKIEEGEMLQGIIDKSIFNKPGKGIVHTTYNDYGPKDAVALIDSLQTVLESYLILKGFSVGISDLIADKNTQDRMDVIIKEKKKQIEEIILQVHMDLFTNNSGKSNQDEFETRIFSILNKAIEELGDLGQESLAAENRLISMIRAGSKGGPINVSQMIACVGQQNVEGKRTPYGFTDRTLPHYKKYNDSAEARGFVESSFIRGLTPQEFFFHAMSGREGLIDTAVKTAETGYTQRKLIKAMEDLMTQHDGTVRDANGNILQFYYGEDGLNSTKIETTILPLNEYNDQTIDEEFGLKNIDFGAILEEGVTRSDDTERINAYVATVKEDQRMILEDVFGGGRMGEIFGPLNLERMILNVKTKFKLNPMNRTDLVPETVLRGIDMIIERTQSYNKTWCATLRYHLSPYNIIVKERFTQTAWYTLVEIILVKNMKAWAIPGELVGIIAAQSIGEPATQMSCVYNTQIRINTSTGYYVGPVGKFIDDILATQKSNVVSLGNDSVVYDPKEDYYIPGVSNKEKTSWNRILQVSRHPANGGLVEVVTNSGRRTTATLSHSFLRRTENGIAEVKGSELLKGHRIPVASSIPEVPNPIRSVKIGTQHIALDKTFGWICGLYLADGVLHEGLVSIHKLPIVVEETIRTWATNHGYQVTIREYNADFGMGKAVEIHSVELRNWFEEIYKFGSSKTISGLVYNAPTAYICGVVGGYFDGDASVNTERQQIRVSSRSKDLIQHISNLCGYAGVFGTLSKDSNESGYYIFNLLRNYADVFEEKVGFHIEEKSKGLHDIVTYNNREDAHSKMGLVDKIPELGDIIGFIAEQLKLPGCSRLYKRWRKKESIGRETLRKYIRVFREGIIEKDEEDPDRKFLEERMAVLEQAAYSDIVWDEIVELNYIDDPKTYVYDFTVPGNDSFMVDNNIFVHNTLNSVDWDTKIIIAKNGKLCTPQIGEMIDEYITMCEKECPEKIQHLPNNQIYIPLEDRNDWKAISCDENGNMKWTMLEAITRHPVVNEDGTDTILEITTDSGRTVKATKAKSFLIYRNGKIEDINGSELSIGDELPIANTLVIDMLGRITSINLRSILSPTEYLYGTDVKKALEIMEHENDTGNRHWFSVNNGIQFTVPYNRSDSFRDAFVNGRNSNDIQSGYVYPKRTRPDISQIPEDIQLTKEFGFFCGAYIAEGMSNDTQISITNNDMDYLYQIEKQMKEWNIGTHITCKERTCEKTGISGTSTSLIIHSTVLARIMSTMFGRISSEKTIPDWTFQAPKDFVEGLVDGYVSGDGNVSKKQFEIKVSSCSNNLMTRLRTLFSSFGIYGKISSYIPELKHFNNVLPHYILRLNAYNSQVFASTFTLSMIDKQEIINKHMLTTDRKNRENVFNQTVLDKITSIKEVTPIKGWVYDITVEETRNFLTENGINMKDTFHLAGVAAKSNMTRGVPRLNELLKVTHNPKASSLTVYLKKEFRDNKDRVREVMQDLELTLLKDITLKSAIYYDPRDENTTIAEDRELLDFYRLFEDREVANGRTAAENRSKWLLRLEFDREKMFNRNITMDDINFVLTNKFFEEINTVYSDYNSTKLVMRIRLTNLSDEQDATFGDHLNALKRFQSKVLNNVIIRGVEGIRAVTFRRSKDFVEKVNGEYTAVDQYVLDTDGSNYIEVMNHPAVNGDRIYSTNVHDVYDQLGIEATRNTLYTEISGLFEDTKINYRHLGLLVDVMTRAGKLMSADRYGINKNNIGPLAKACFEETEKILLDAARFGEIDPVTGVSANIMTGQPIRGGTAFSQILLDEEALPRLLAGQPAVPGEEEEEEEEFILTQENIDNALYEDENDPCSLTRLTMNIHIPTLEDHIEEDDIEITTIS